MNVYNQRPLILIRGEGCVIWDDTGRKYLDLNAGMAVNILGHAHPAVVEAIKRQAELLIHVSNLYYSQPQLELARRLTELAFPSRVFFSNSGAEANEAAIKLARKWGRRHRQGAYRIITAERSFHGRTLAVVTASGNPAYSEPFQPLPDGFDHVPYGDIDALYAATTEQTAAILLEPILGEGGVIPPPEGYLLKVRQWCDEQGMLLILDEVQTGICRTGRWFAHQHHGILPDVMTLAKGLAGGVPIGVCLASPRADVLGPGEHGSTFGGNPLASAAALAVLAVAEQEALAEHAVEMGELLAETFQRLVGISEVRGMGLLRAVMFRRPVAKLFRERAQAAGILINALNDHTVRLAPPLIINADQIKQAGMVLRGISETIEQEAGE
ncbi:MAG: acetylornithine transaminase [Candidatus Dormibacteraceae bacterium]